MKVDETPEINTKAIDMPLEKTEAKENENNNVENNLEISDESKHHEITNAAAESTNENIGNGETELSLEKENEINRNIKIEEEDNHEDNIIEDPSKIQEKEEASVTVNEKIESNDQVEHGNVDVSGEKEVHNDVTEIEDNSDSNKLHSAKEGNHSVETRSSSLNHNGDKEDEATEKAEVLETTNNEGNNNELNEDDDDVQIPGDTPSDYSDYNQKSTAELSDGSAKRGKTEISSGTIRETIQI